MNKRKFDALPPRGIEWQVGKTIESIRFVNDSEKFISTCQDINKIDILRSAIQQIKDGSLILLLRLTPEEYLLILSFGTTGTT